MVLLPRHLTANRFHPPLYGRLLCCDILWRMGSFHSGPTYWRSHGHMFPYRRSAPIMACTKFVAVRSSCNQRSGERSAAEQLLSLYPSVQADLAPLALTVSHVSFAFAAAVAVSTV